MTKELKDLITKHNLTAIYNPKFQYWSVARYLTLEEKGMQREQMGDPAFCSTGLTLEEAVLDVIKGIGEWYENHDGKECNKKGCCV